nr:uncharacterized protein LOC118035753 isoform X1 [Populus alba]
MTWESCGFWLGHDMFFSLMKFGTSLILLRSWCEIGLVFLREAFPTITLNSSTVNFFPNCSSLLLAFQEIYFSSCCLSSIVCCLTGLVCLCVGALGDLLGAGTLRTFYSQLLRSDYLCWGLCFFVFFCSFDLLPSQKSPRSNPSLGSHCVFHLHCTLCLL